ncbi:S1C family serine protease [Blastococcus haudaquaticus]|uniref:Putative serine protease PepD n=1 Tax=Blastococcus haudaquaticus TaxID=1938745 RepID=A0A286H0C6_9ACTN|nr:trypsin-like peptidase domain-containing protein [Blastococcus haudaquaticus]SOE00799.1 putative serine protease PepD [Blastococcus haudaquaticus]
MTESGQPTVPGTTPGGQGPEPLRTPDGTPSYAAPGGSSPWSPPFATAPQPTSYPGYGGHPTPPAGPAPAAAPESRRAGRLRIGLAGLVAGALIGGGAGAGVVALVDDPAGTSGTPAAAQSVVIQNPESATTATAAAAKAAPSVVTIYVSSASSSGSGSGVVLTDDGYVLTNNHVVAGGGSGGSVQVRTSDGTLYGATVVGTDPASDLAVLRLEGAEDLTPATFADSEDVQVGDVAVAIGAPLGLSNTVTDGIISATDRAVQTGSTQDDATVIDALQTDAAINPGNSGGALVNGAGEVIGINTAIATVASGVPGSQSQSGNIGVGFAIPSNTAQRIAQEIVETGSATRAFLGVTAQTAADDANSEVGTGAEIVSVEPDSAAAGAGLQEGDVVTAVGDRPVTTSTELTAAVRSQAPGETVELTVRRGDQTRTAEVTLGSTS